MDAATLADLEFPIAIAPDNGTVREIAPGLLWLRLALPFALDHVNVYLLEEHDGWAVLDTGLGDAASRAAWTALLDGTLRGERLGRIVVTHFHPDHVGMAGFLAERFDAELLMSRTDFLYAQMLRGHGEALESPAHIGFMRRHGLDEATVAAVVGRGHAYLRMTTPLPPAYRRLAAGDRVTLGGRRIDVLTGGGHAPEQLMFLDRGGRQFFAADQVLARISPNVSVWAWEPEADPLAEYLASLARLRAEVPDDVLVLPGHNLPFRGLHARIEALIAHHRERCDRVAAACGTPRSAAEIVPVLFPRALDPHQTGFAFGEVLAHVNYMLGTGELVAERRRDGVQRVRAA